VTKPELTSSAVPEAFDVAVKNGLSAINGLVLLGCTLSSAALTLYADLSARGAPALTGTVAIVAWLATLMLALYLAGRSKSNADTWQNFRLGATMASTRPGFALVVATISAGAVFSAWSKSHSDSGGVLSRLLPQLEAVRDDTAAIRKEVTRNISPSEQLARQGFTLAKEDICRALSHGRVEAFRLMAATGLPSAPVAISLGGGQYATCIEEALLGRTQRHGRWLELLSQLPNPGGELDRPYLSQAMGWGQEHPVDLQAIARGAGLRIADSSRLVYLFAPLLMYAVWGNDAQAVEALLKAGADPNVSATVELVYPPLYNSKALSVTVLAEAERLEHSEIAALLRASGGLAITKAAPSMFDTGSNPAKR